MDTENCFTFNSLKTMNLLQLTKEEYLAVISGTREMTGFNPNVIEKDWWVTMTLRALFESSCADFLTFKGGTSLSKCWNLIERFSEDVDIAIDKSFWNLEGDTKSQRDRIRKLSRHYIEQTLTPELDMLLREYGARDFELSAVPNKESDADPTVVLIPYMSAYSTNPYVKPTVKIEFSCRSLKEPRAKVSVKPLVANKFPKQFEDFNVELFAVLPSRTFLEKIFLIHEELQKDKPRVERMSRHLYDIERMMDTSFADEALKNTGMYNEIVEHRNLFNHIRGIDYRTHSPKTINIIPSGELYEQWKNDYAVMQKNFIYGKSLTFDELMGRITELQNRSRNIRTDDLNL